MVKSWKVFSVAIVLWLICLVLTVPYPDALTIERGVSVLNVLVKTESGYQVEGIVTILLLIVSLCFLWMAVKKHQVIWGITAILGFVFAPAMLVNVYQNTIATGIAAVSYDVDKSDCRFNLVDDFTLKGVCRLPLQNLSSDDVTFTIEFYETYWYEDGIQIVSLMNEGAPYEAMLKGKQKKWVKVETLIDVSQIENHIEKGTVSGVHIIIHAGEWKRRL